MRAMECATPKCAHIHANTNEQLVDELVRHMREVHPEAVFTSVAARRAVEAEAYDDVGHEGRKHSWADSTGSLGGGLPGSG